MLEQNELLFIEAFISEILGEIQHNTILVFWPISDRYLISMLDQNGPIRVWVWLLSIEHPRLWQVKLMSLPLFLFPLHYWLLLGVHSWTSEFCDSLFSNSFSKKKNIGLVRKT